VRQLNLALKFLLELGALAAFAFWAASLVDGVWAVLLAIALPVVAAAVWGTFAAPRSRRRLSLHPRIGFELGFFALAAVAFWRAGSAVSAAVFAALVVANALLLTAFDQWEA
jgi:hypothetical protein